MKSGWLVSSNHAQLTPQKRNWLGKESITARFRRLLLRRTVLVNARRPSSTYRPERWIWTISGAKVRVGDKPVNMDF
jgi:hypothetical protein